MKKALLLFLAFAFLSCKRDKDLPKPTTSGKNTFGCLVDGKSFTPNGKGFQSKSLAGGFTIGGIPPDENYNNFYADAYDDKTKTSIIIYVRYVNNTGKFQLGHTQYLLHEGPYPENYASITTSDGCQYVTDSLHTGVIEFTRVDNDVVSGTFSFRAKGIRGCQGEKSITSGRFDFDLHTL